MGPMEWHRKNIAPLNSGHNKVSFKQSRIVGVHVGEHVNVCHIAGDEDRELAHTAEC